MCTMSMIFDTFGPHIPQPLPTFIPGPVPNTPPTVTPNVLPSIQVGSLPPVAEGVDNETLRELIGAFRDAIDAARRFDNASGQPDCEDPDKAKILERVEELERRLDELETR